MTYKIALLHTSFVFIQRERLLFDIFAELLPDAELTNIVEDTMLADVMRTQTISPQVVRRMSHYILAADAIGVDAIFSTCSSLGPAVDAAAKLVSTPVVKIDDGMAEKAARDGNKIGVLATVPTTLGPTIDLIQHNAQRQGRQIETQRALSEGAFALLMANQVEQHDDMVVQTACATAEWADTLVLAQCSMARLAPRLEQETGRPVLSSPRLGVQRLKDVLEGQRAIAG